MRKAHSCGFVVAFGPSAEAVPGPTVTVTWASPGSRSSARNAIQRPARSPEARRFTAASASTSAAVAIRGRNRELPTRKRRVARTAAGSIP